MAQFLDKDGLQYLVERIKEFIDQATQVNIVTTLDENSTNQDVPGALAVYELILDMLDDVTGLKLEVVTDLPTTGESNVIYLIEVDDDKFSKHIYSNDKWYGFGTTEVNLSSYWAKADLAAMSNAEIQETIDEVWGV